MVCHCFAAPRSRERETKPSWFTSRIFRNCPGIVRLQGTEESAPRARGWNFKLARKPCAFGRLLSA
jgi:hypothetical protein